MEVAGYTTVAVAVPAVIVRPLLESRLVAAPLQKHPYWRRQILHIRLPLALVEMAFQAQVAGQVAIILCLGVSYPSVADSVELMVLLHPSLAVPVVAQIIHTVLQRELLGKVMLVEMAPNPLLIMVLAEEVERLRLEGMEPALPVVRVVLEFPHQSLALL